MKSTDIILALPAYNEELTIRQTLLDFARELPQAKIVVVDNNSKDATSKIAEETIIKHQLNAELIFESKQGKGFAIRKVFTEYEADIYIMADADLTYPAKEVHRLLQPVMEGHTDVVVGDRHSSGAYKKENSRSLHGFGNRLVRNLINFLFKSDLEDIMSGYRVLSRKFVKNYPIMVTGFQLETDMTLHILDKRFTIKEIPIDFIDRPEGSFSKLHTYQDGLKVLFTIVNIFRVYKPLKFYASFTIFFAFLTLFSSLPVINDWIEHRYIYHLPLAILSTGLGIVTILSLSLGLVLNAITHQHNVDFEHKILNFK